MTLPDDDVEMYKASRGIVDEQPRANAPRKKENEMVRKPSKIKIDNRNTSSILVDAKTMITGHRPTMNHIPETSPKIRRVETDDAIRGRGEYNSAHRRGECWALSQPNKEGP